MKDYDNLVRIRDQNVDGVSEWVWPKEDTGAWDGPHREWMETHKNAYLKYCKKRDVVVQAGGNCGLYPRLFSQYFKHVYTFEPESINFHCLVNNCQMHNIYKFNAALGDRNMFLRVKMAGMSNVGTHIVDPSEPGGHTMQFALDTFPFETVDLIQLDVEGYEIKILNGAIATIEKHKPVISMENGYTPPIREFMESRGYKMQIQVGADYVWSVN